MVPEEKQADTNTLRDIFTYITYNIAILVHCVTFGHFILPMYHIFNSLFLPGIPRSVIPFNSIPSLLSQKLLLSSHRRYNKLCNEFIHPATWRN